MSVIPGRRWKLYVIEALWAARSRSDITETSWCTSISMLWIEGWIWVWDHLKRQLSSILWVFMVSRSASIVNDHDERITGIARRVVAASLVVSSSTPDNFAGVQCALEWDCVDCLRVNSRPWKARSDTRFPNVNMVAWSKRYPSEHYTIEVINMWQGSVQRKHLQEPTSTS